MGQNHTELGVWAVTAVAATVILVGGWLGHLGETGLVEAELIGGPETFRASDREGYTEASTWTHQVSLESAASTAFLPVFHYEVQTGGPGVQGPVIEVTAWVNDEEVYQQRVDVADAPSRLQGVLPSASAEETAVGAVEGENEIRVHAQVTRPAGASGWTEVTLGPVQVQHHALDRTGDGIPDDEQLLPGLHMGLVTLPLALATAAGTKVGLSRWLEAREARP